MCFSAQADLVVGIAVTAIAVDAARHVSQRGEWALAALPMVLGVHLLTEVPVWRGLDGAVGSDAWRPWMYAYLVIAFVVIPVLVPVAVGALEPVRDRRRSAPFVVLGVLVAGILLRALVRGPVDAEVVGHHISYSTGLSGGGVVVGLYLVATCGSLLASSSRRLHRFAVVNLVVVAVLIVVDRSAFISLWCAWAALVSIAIASHLRTGPTSATTVTPGRHPAHGGS